MVHNWARSEQAGSTPLLSHFYLDNVTEAKQGVKIHLDDANRNDNQILTGTNQKDKAEFRSYSSLNQRMRSSAAHQE